MIKPLRLAALSLCAVMLSTSLAQPAFASSYNPDDIWAQIEASKRGETTKPSSSSSSESTTKGRSFKFEPSTTYKYSSLSKKIKKYAETNKDVKGWLVVPGTNINEPIVFSNKDKNNFYLYRDWTGKNYPNTTYNNFVDTATYVDYRYIWGESWKSSSKNTVLYGHNWTNLRAPLDIGNVSKHTMFGQLPSYTDVKFAKENPHIYFSTGENEGVWRVFSVGYTELSKNFNYNVPNPKDASYQKILDEWDKRSILDFDVDVDTSDRILTLTTCTRMYNLGEKQRFVVVARLLRSGESENDKVTVTAKKSYKTPSL